MFPSHDPPVVIPAFNSSRNQSGRRSPNAPSYVDMRRASATFWRICAVVDMDSGSLVSISRKNELIRITKPRYWVIENVIGSIKYFEAVGLTQRQIHGAHVLYGNFPMFQCGKLPTKASKDKTSTNPLRANHKALIPLELSAQLRKAIVDQKTLFDFD